MVEFRWIITSLFLMLVFSFPAATGRHSSFTVRAGDEVTLTCENVIDGQHKCNSTTWTFRHLRNTVPLFELGQIHKDAKAKSDRLSVTANCSLVIKKVTVEDDGGPYFCLQYNKSGKQQGPDSVVHLSVVNMTDIYTKEVQLLTFSPQSSGETTVWWRFIIASVGLAALLITVVTVNIWTRTKGNKTQMDENMEHDDEDEDDGTVNYENVGDPSASVRLH